MASEVERRMPDAITTPMGSPLPSWVRWAVFGIRDVGFPIVVSGFLLGVLTGLIRTPLTDIPMMQAFLAAHVQAQTAMEVELRQSYETIHRELVQDRCQQALPIDLRVEAYRYGDPCKWMEDVYLPGRVKR